MSQLQIPLIRGIRKLEELVNTYFIFDTYFALKKGLKCIRQAYQL